MAFAARYGPDIPGVIDARVIDARVIDARVIDAPPVSSTLVSSTPVSSTQMQVGALSGNPAAAVAGTIALLAPSPSVSPQMRGPRMRGARMRGARMRGG